MLGYTAEQWLADPTLWRRRIHLDDVARVMSADVEHAADGPSPSTVPTTYRMLRADGTTIWVRDAAAVERDVEGRLVYHGVLTDVTAEKALEARLEYLVEHDHLTGLLNAQAFGQRLSGALSHLGEGGSVSVVFVDLDKFKQVNDEYGHGVGDALLRQIGSSLSAATRSLAGAEAGRIGGDEFVVLLGGSDRTGTERLAARVLVAVQRASVPVGGRLVGVGASVGFSTGQAGDSADALLSRADRAMYRAKMRGGGRVGLVD
jgi:diguanylate cyclase (GGDEF)-like protein